MEPDGEIIAITHDDLNPREQKLDLSSREDIEQRLTQLQRDFQDLAASARDMRTQLGKYPEVIDDTHGFDQHLLDLYKAVGLTNKQ